MVCDTQNWQGQQGARGRAGCPRFAGAGCPARHEAACHGPAYALARNPATAPAWPQFLTRQHLGGCVAINPAAESSAYERQINDKFMRRRCRVLLVEYAHTWLLTPTAVQAIEQLMQPGCGWWKPEVADVELLESVRSSLRRSPRECGQVEALWAVERVLANLRAALPEARHEP